MGSWGIGLRFAALAAAVAAAVLALARLHAQADLDELQVGLPLWACAYGTLLAPAVTSATRALM